jgi:uncharacterized membrane protein
VNWFERHLNWTVVLACWVGVPLAIGLSLLLVALTGSFIPIFLGYFVAPLAALWVVAWVIKEKGRNQFWLLVVLLFGFIPALLLQNRTHEKS